MLQAKQELESNILIFFIHRLSIAFYIEDFPPVMFLLWSQSHAEKMLDYWKMREILDVLDSAKLQAEIIIMFSH